jgi:MFS family permease
MMQVEPAARTRLLLLYAARALRGVGDGFAIIILPAYLSAIGATPTEIGFVAAASLLGTALATLVVGFIAPRHDLRSLLMAGAGLVACTGVAFSNVENLALILVVAFIGTVNPSTGDLGVLVPLEHAMLAHAVRSAAGSQAPRHRATDFAAARLKLLTWGYQG